MKSLNCFHPVLIATMFLACEQTTKPEEPFPFVGKWYGEFSGVKASMDFRPDHSYENRLTTPAETATFRGEWEYSPPYLLTKDSECREGLDLRLVLCESKVDSIRLSIHGDEWIISMLDEDAGAVTFTMTRIHL